MQEPDEDITGYITSLLLGEEPDTTQQQPVHTMSLRLPMDTAALLIELALSADKSRVEMARLLVWAGIDSVLSRLPVETAHDIREAARERLDEMLSEG